MSSGPSISPRCPWCQGTQQAVITNPPLKGANLNVAMVVCEDCHVILGVLPAAGLGDESGIPPSLAPHPGVNRP